MNYQLLGKILKGERKFNQLSQKDVAKKLDINQSTISRVEKGEINKTELFEMLFQFYNLQLFGENKKIKIYFEKIYQAMEFNDVEKESQIFLEVTKIKELAFDEYYEKKLLECLHYLYIKDFKQFRFKLDYISNFEYVLDELMKRYYFLIKGYDLHIQKKYQQANQEFKKVISFITRHQITDNVFSFIYALNNIILGNLSISQFFLEKSKIDCKKKNNHQRLIYIDRLLSYIHFLSSNYKESIETSKEFSIESNHILSNRQINTQTEFIIAASYILLEKYDEAIKYLKIIIDKCDKDYLEIYYAYLFFCLKVSNNSYFQPFFIQFENEAIFQIEDKRYLIESFISENMDIELFLYKFDYILNNTNNNMIQYKVHVKLLFSIFKDDLWTKRKYAIYKKFDDIIISRKLKENLNYDL